MGRKANLINESYAVLKTLRKGSNTTKKRYFNVMQNIVNDLWYIHQAPKTFMQLSREQIQSLIVFWKKRGNNSATIINKLSVLRKYLKLAKLSIEIPTNKELNLARESGATKNIVFDESIIDKVYHPITKSVIAWQFFFGLTKVESIKIRNDQIRENRLIIYRDIAHNNKDRVIPVVTDDQKQAIMERRHLLNDKNSLLDLNSFKIICELYNAELNIAKLSFNTAFRKYYALRRMVSLIKHHAKEVAYRKLQQELGFASIYSLKKWFFYE
jgi:hypothetical protein